MHSADVVPGSETGSISISRMSKTLSIISITSFLLKGFRGPDVDGNFKPSIISEKRGRFPGAVALLRAQKELFTWLDMVVIDLL